ncbi:hypothetical protein Tco_1431256 [Tanacetum coccineum]
MDKRNKHFTRLRAEEQRRKPLTKAQKRNQISTYLKNMAGYTYNQLNNKIYDEVQEAFDKTMKWIDSFVPMDQEVEKYSQKKAEGSDKREGATLEQEVVKKQKVDKDQETAELKQLIKVIQEEEIAIDVIPLATKSPKIIDWKIYKEGRKSCNISYFQGTFNP